MRLLTICATRLLPRQRRPLDNPPAMIGALKRSTQPSLSVAQPAADAGCPVLGGQHGRGQACHRPDLALPAGVPALGGGDGRAVAHLWRAGARALASDQAAAARHRGAGLARVHGLQCALLRGCPLHERHQHRHPARLDADLRAGGRVHRARHPREPGAARRRARHGRRRRGGRDPRRAARRSSRSSSTRAIWRCWRRARSMPSTRSALRDRPDMPGTAFFTLLALIAAVTSLPLVALEAAIGGFKMPTANGLLDHRLGRDLPVVPFADLLSARRRSDRPGARRACSSISCRYSPPRSPWP